MKLTYLAGSVAVAEAWEWSLVDEVTCLENSSYQECGTDREICGGMEHMEMSSDCYRGCFCDDGYIQTRAGVCIPEADCSPAGEITCLVAQFESYLTFFGFDATLISGFDWTWSGLGNHCDTPTPPSPWTPKTPKTPKTKTPKTKTPKTKTPKTKTPKTKTPKTKTPKTKTPKTKTPKTKTPKTKTPKTKTPKTKTPKTKTPKSGKTKTPKSGKGKSGRRRREIDSPQPRFSRSGTGKSGKSGKGKSGYGKSGTPKSPKSGYGSPSPQICYPNYLENFCSYIISNYGGDHVDRLSALCYGPFFATTLNNVLYIQQFTATFGISYSQLFCPVFDSGNFFIDLTTINFADFNLDIDVNIDYNINLITHVNTYQNVMIEFIQSCGFTGVIEKILIQLTMEFNWNDFYGEFEAVFEFFTSSIAEMLLDVDFVAQIVLVDADVVASLGNVITVFISQNIEVFFTTNIEFSIGGNFDWDCSNDGWCFTPPQIPVPYESAAIACESIGGQVAGSDHLDFISGMGQVTGHEFWMHFDVSNACSYMSGLSNWNMNLNAFVSHEHGYIDVGHSDKECSFICTKPQAPLPPVPPEGGVDFCHSIIGGKFEQYMWAVGSWTEMNDSDREFYPASTDAETFDKLSVIRYESDCGMFKFSLKCLKNNSDNLYYWMPCNSIRCSGFDREIWLTEEKLNGIIDGSYQMNCN
ncbi:Oidioi.mRNA.OKI2018_I69.chr1.g338.t1.cds [Oikopleura dioica]|uniref:Oidioi.mRNA.OKI2018_I69.chr1.g338.t1.cds n=1 Tax=Oikopleura dioica TaxID=34765 RepID=A0ABN7SND1_OIKDI|nr:Oidioi.mRNA.OKI2018_I69.chr1.g338.t1.cds [Oikopleura dioica]